MAFGPILPFLGLILAVNVGNELIKILRRVMVEDTATRTEKKARGLVLCALLRAPLAYFKENMTGNIHGRLNRCLEGTVKLEKLLFMDFAPAIFNSAAAIFVIFTTLPAALALPMLLVIPIGTAIVLRQIETQKGIRVELLDTKAEFWTSWRSAPCWQRTSSRWWTCRRTSPAPRCPRRRATAAWWTRRAAGGGSCCG